jgi:HPt (histidine-containing phosphotransfer) domain-containing protein
VSIIHLDYNVLSTLQEVMEGEYVTLLDVFVRDAEQRISLLRQSASGPDMDLQELSMTAHSLKGSSSNMGALRLSELCHQLEERARRHEVVGLDELIGSIATEYATVKRLFDAERQLLTAQS